MPVRFENYIYLFRSDKGKPIFVPNDRSREIGNKIKSFLELHLNFEPYYYHLRRGGHVGALHSHRPNSYYARIDIERFFYSIGRNRVANALREASMPRAGHLAKWSCVPNPYPGSGSRFILPYGFVQSPILATLVMRDSAVGSFLRQLPVGITISVYVDDISLSSNDLDALTAAYRGLREAIGEAGFTLNEAKCAPPSAETTVFNCDLRQDEAEVTDERKRLFYSVPRNGPSADAFERYCASVRQGNA